MDEAAWRPDGTPQVLADTTNTLRFAVAGPEVLRLDDQNTLWTGEPGETAAMVAPDVTLFASTADGQWVATCGEAGLQLRHQGAMVPTDPVDCSQARGLDLVATDVGVV